MATINIQRILVPTDFSKYADQAFRYAADLAKDFGAALSILHVVPEGDLREIYAYPQDIDLDQIIRDQQRIAGERFKQMVAGEASRGVAFETTIYAGKPFLEIVNAAKGKKANLIVMATRGRTGLSHLFMGSVAEKVVRMAPCPVLTMKSREEEPSAASLKISHILCPIDFSDPSKGALQYAIAFAQKYQAKLTLLHVIQMNIYAVDELHSGVIPAEMLGELGRKATAELDTLASGTEAASLDVSTKVAHGVPFLQILAEAKESNVDLVVMATHGRTGLRYALMGSVAEKIVREADCPVLTVGMQESS